MPSFSFLAPKLQVWPILGGNSPKKPFLWGGGDFFQNPYPKLRLHAKFQLPSIKIMFLEGVA